LAVCMVSMAVADSAGVASKIATAQAAVSAGKGKEAAADLNAVAEMLDKDAAGAGEFAQAFAAWQSKSAKQLAEELGKGAKVKEVRIEILALRTADLYGALIPAGKGEFTAAAAHLTKLATGAPEVTKAGLQEAAKALSDAAAGKGDKRVALGMMNVRLGSSVALAKAIELIEQDKPKVAAVWAISAVEYMGLEEKAAGAQAAEGINDLALDVKGGLINDLEGGRRLEMDEVKSVFEAIEEIILDAYKSSPPPGEKKAELPAEKKAEAPAKD